MKHILVLLVLLFSTNTTADVYIDLGFTYIDDVNVVSSAKVDIFGYESTAEVTHNLEVKSWVPMLRVGFIHNGWGIEYDTIGSPSVMIPRINGFYRFEFD